MSGMLFKFQKKVGGSKEHHCQFYFIIMHFLIMHNLRGG